MKQTILNKAMNFARAKHEGQYRDDNRTSYIVHPIEVAQILELVGSDDNLIAAGYLHDVLEDTRTSYGELKEVFGKDIAHLVKEVTKKKSGDGTYFPHLKTHRGIVLKFADRLSNLSDMKTWNDKKRHWYLKSSKFWKSE